MNNLNQWVLDLRNCTPDQLNNLRVYLLENNQAIFADTEAELLRGKIDILYPVLAFYDHDEEWLSYELEELQDRTEISYDEFMKIFPKNSEVVCDVKNFERDVNELIAKYQRAGLGDGDITFVLQGCIINVKLPN